MSQNYSNSQALLRQKYAEKLSDFTVDLKTTPLWNILGKKKGKIVKGAKGLGFVVPLITENGFSTAQAYTDALAAAIAGSETSQAFNIPAKFNYTVKMLDDQYAALSDGDGGFVDALDRQVEVALRESTNVIAQEASGSGFGGICTLTAASTATTFKVHSANKQLIRVGAEYQAAAAEGSGALISATALKVTGVDSTGLCTVTGGSPLALGWVSGSTIFLKGTRENVASPSRLRPTGLAAYNPIAAPAPGTLLHGVDIGSNYKLSGLRKDGSSGTLKDNLITFMGDFAIEGQESNPTDVLMNPIQWAAFNAALDNSTRLQNVADEKSTKFGFQSIMIAAPHGAVNVVADMTIRYGEVRLLNRDHVYWITGEYEPIHLFSGEVGQPFKPQDGGVGFETRVRSMVNLVCDRPNSLGVLYGVP